tara:strand:+ start:546 stop:758 length:213 start_codon:yes stop_codon:yes gene_type:complete
MTVPSPYVTHRPSTGHRPNYWAALLCPALFWTKYFGISEGFFLGLQTDFDLMEKRRELAAELDSILPMSA